MEYFKLSLQFTLTSNINLQTYFANKSALWLLVKEKEEPGKCFRTDSLSFRTICLFICMYVYLYLYVMCMELLYSTGTSGLGSQAVSLLMYDALYWEYGPAGINRAAHSMHLPNYPPPPPPPPHLTSPNIQLQHLFSSLREAVLCAQSLMTTWIVHCTLDTMSADTRLACSTVYFFRILNFWIK